jgi:hypothetical protein
MSKRLNVRSGKKLFTASCSSSKNSKAMASLVNKKSSRCDPLRFVSASLPLALRGLASPNTSVPSPVLSMSLTSLRFDRVLTLPYRCSAGSLSRSSKLLDVQTHGQPSLAQIRGQSWFSAQYRPFEIRPELGAEIAGEVEPELEGSLQHAQAHGI